MSRITLPTPDGQLSVLDEGEGPTVVLVHGTPSSLFTWTWLLFGKGEFEGLPSVIPDRDVYALDIVGHGVTRTESPPYTFQRCADWLASFLAHRDLRDAVVVGNSYGGEFVWRAALDHPELIESLVLLDSVSAPPARASTASRSCRYRLERRPLLWSRHGIRLR